MAKFEATLNKLKVTFEHDIATPTAAYFRSNPFKATAAALIIGYSVLQAAVGIYEYTVPAYQSVAAYVHPAPKPEVTMVGRWASDADPSRILTIDSNLHFNDSKINGGTLLPHGHHAGLYAFLYGGEAKCWATIVPISHDKLLLNDFNSHQAACITGMLKRVS